MGGRAQATGAGPGLQAWLQALPSGAWRLPGGPSVDWPLWWGVPAQAPRKHLRVPTGWALPAGNGRDRNFGALWQRGEEGSLLDTPGGRRGGGGAAPAHPSGRQGPGEAPSARAPRGGRPRGTRRGRGDTCPKTPAPPHNLCGPAPDKAPPLQAPPPPPAPGGPAWPCPARASPSPCRLRPARGLPRPGRASPGRRRRRLGAGARSSLLWCGRRCRYGPRRSRCRCRGLRSRRRLHRSGDIVPLNRSPRRPAPPARRRDLSATAPPRRHDGEVRGTPSPHTRLLHLGGGAASSRAAMLGVASRVALKGPARPESPGRGSVTMTTFLSSCPQWLFITPLVLPMLGLLIAPEEWGGGREVPPWVIHRSLLRTPHGESLAFSPLLPISYVPTTSSFPPSSLCTVNFSTSMPLELP